MGNEYSAMINKLVEQTNLLQFDSGKVLEIYHSQNGKADGCKNFFVRTTYESRFVRSTSL